MKKPFVIVIAGPTGVGKTTLSKILSNHYNCLHLSEDEVAKQAFPSTYKDVEDFPEKLKVIESKLLDQTKTNFNNGADVVVDCINLEKEFIEKMRKIFHEHLVVKVLFPQIETIIERDRKREIWISGEDTIRLFYKKYEELKPFVGEENYIDNSHQIPEETSEKIIATVEGKD